ncbi:hypothetical protein [Pseudoduganella sp. OTU4001]|uniref:hypothetical protein n=1 Tax=Pseudoduganella sp. OTU4001 TaxID=3043854 RepID=UPI00313AEC1D
MVQHQRQRAVLQHVALDHLQPQGASGAAGAQQDRSKRRASPEGHVVGTWHDGFSSCDEDEPDACLCPAPQKPQVLLRPGRIARQQL